jgi:multiple sugar transport system substrate-binding protein
MDIRVPARGQMIDSPKPDTLGVSRREFLHLAGLAAANAALGACSSPVSGTADKSGDVVQLVYQDWRTDWFPPMVHEMLEEFHAIHPNIRVFFVPDPENFSEKMLADFQAGTAPDVFQGCCVHFPSWAQQGYTLDLRPYVEADLDREVVDDWNPAQYESLFLADGHQFGLPKYHGALALYFNKDLFDEYGLDYPDDSWDHDDYLAAMVRLTRDRNGDGQIDLWGSMLDISWERIQIHVNGWGGHLVDPADPTKCAMASPQAVAALEWLRARMWDDKVMATQHDVEYMETRDAFSNGRVAMVEDGSWALKDILSNADFRVGVAPLPAGPVRRVTLATTDGFGIYAGTRYPEAAWELLKFLVSKAYGRAMARANFLQPARASLVDDWVGYIREELPEKAGDMDLAAFAAGHIEGYSVTGEIFANMAEAKHLAYDAWNQIFTQGKAPPGDMVDVCARIEASQVREE